MIEFVLFFTIIYIVCFLVMAGKNSSPKVKKGSFTVYGYKNGELIYKETFIDSIYAVEPGNKFDKIEIVD